MWEWSDIKWRLFIAIVIIVIIITVIFIYHNRCNNRYLDGLWVCDDEFCNESELTGFWIMIGSPALDWWGSKTTMYIVMFNENGMLCNKSVDVLLGHLWSTGDYVNRKLTILDDSFDIMPTSMTLSLNRELGHMVLYGRDEGVDQDEDTIFGTFYKDNESSHKAKLLRGEL
jgi:hypothetical protein